MTTSGYSRQDIAQRIQEALGPEWEKEHGIVDVDELYKSDKLRALFRSIEIEICEEDWYESIHDDTVKGSKGDLFTAFANSLFTEVDRWRFNRQRDLYYNIKTTIPKTEFRRALAEALRIGIEPSLETKKSGTANPSLKYNLVKVPWGQLLQFDEGNVRLNLGEDYPLLEPKIPGYQRPRRWTPSKIRGFVSSLREGLPIPSLTVFHNEDDDCYDVLDGQQRLESAINSYDLWKDSIPTEAEVGVYVVKGLEDVDNKQVRKERIKLYTALNTGGVNLSSLEIRVGTWHEHPLLEQLIELTKDSVLKVEIKGKGSIEEQDSWKSHIATICRGRKSIESTLQSKALNINELEIVDHLLRPLVYGHKDGNVYVCRGLTTMKGIDHMFELIGDQEIVADIRNRLTKALGAAYAVFNHDGVEFLKLAKGLDEEGEIVWQGKNTLNKTATALQVGAFYSHLDHYDHLDDQTTQDIREKWKEFIKNEYLDDTGKARNQNARQLWHWQEIWSDTVQNLIGNLTPVLTEDERAVFEKARTKISPETLLEWFGED